MQTLDDFHHRNDDIIKFKKMRQCLARCLIPSKPNIFDSFALPNASRCSTLRGMV
jgi:hypothetical protein